MSTDLAKLQAANLPRVKWHDVLKPAEGSEPPSEADQYAMDTYFSCFVPWQKDEAGRQVCVGCRRMLRGGIDGFLLGGAPDSATMEWSLTHGECHCSKCGWPARAYHFDIGLKDDPIIKRMSLTLQYHPDTIRPAPSAPESEH